MCVCVHTQSSAHSYHKNKKPESTWISPTPLHCKLRHNNKEASSCFWKQPSSWAGLYTFISLITNKHYLIYCNSINTKKKKKAVNVAGRHGIKWILYDYYPTLTDDLTVVLCTPELHSHCSSPSCIPLNLNNQLYSWQCFYNANAAGSLRTWLAQSSGSSLDCSPKQFVRKLPSSF